MSPRGNLSSLPGARPLVSTRYLCGWRAEAESETEPQQSEIKQRKNTYVRTYVTYVRTVGSRSRSRSRWVGGRPKPSGGRGGPKPESAYPSPPCVLEVADVVVFEDPSRDAVATDVPEHAVPRSLPTYVRTHVRTYDSRPPRAPTVWGANGPLRPLSLTLSRHPPQPLAPSPLPTRPTPSASKRCSGRLAPLGVGVRRGKWREREERGVCGEAGRSGPEKAAGGWGKSTYARGWVGAFRDS